MLAELQAAAILFPVSLRPSGASEASNVRFRTIVFFGSPGGSLQSRALFGFSDKCQSVPNQPEDVDSARQPASEKNGGGRSLVAFRYKGTGLPQARCVSAS
jgi:hypothetical protein